MYLTALEKEKNTNKYIQSIRIYIMKTTISTTLIITLFISIISLPFASCGDQKKADVDKSPNEVYPEDWPTIKALPLGPANEKQIDEILPKLT